MLLSAFQKIKRFHSQRSRFLPCKISQSLYYANVYQDFYKRRTQYKVDRYLCVCVCVYARVCVCVCVHACMCSASFLSSSRLVSKPRPFYLLTCPPPHPPLPPILVLSCIVSHLDYGRSLPPCSPTGPVIHCLQRWTTEILGAHRV